MFFFTLFMIFYNKSFSLLHCTPFYCMLYSLRVYFYCADIIEYCIVMRTYYLKDLKVRRRGVTIHEGFSNWWLSKFHKINAQRIYLGKIYHIARSSCETTGWVLGRTQRRWWILMKIVVLLIKRFLVCSYLL